MDEGGHNDGEQGTTWWFWALLTGVCERLELLVDDRRLRNGLVVHHEQRSFGPRKRHRFRNDGGLHRRAAEHDAGERDDVVPREDASAGDRAAERNDQP